jgi:Gram-negative porin
MWQAVRIGGTAVAVGSALAIWAAPAMAASDVDVGGYQDQALEAVHRDLIGPAAEDSRYTIRLESGENSALTAFTPRFGALGLGSAGGLPDYRLGGDQAGAAPASDQASGGTQSLLVGLSGTEIAGWAVDLAATAGMVKPSATAATGDSGLVVGGQLAISSLSFDAAYGQDAALMGLGLDGTRKTLGVSYGLGPVDTHVSYSVVDRQTAVNSNLFTVGSRLALTPGLALQGDVAYADDKNGDSSTAGRVSLRLNF